MKLTIIYQDTATIVPVTVEKLDFAWQYDYWPGHDEFFNVTDLREPAYGAEDTY